MVHVPQKRLICLRGKKVCLEITSTIRKLVSVGVGSEV
ncbi:putative exported protein [Chlamydia psittaci 08DC60]|nr:putative exported protein [Chlamydia psittaci 08DC60]